MKRGKRSPDTNNKDSIKNILYLTGSILGIAVLAFLVTFILYGNKVNKEAELSKINTEKISELVPNTTNTTNTTSTSSETAQTSTQIGKTVEESKEEKEEKQEKSNKTNTTVEKQKSNTAEKTNTTKTNSTVTSKKNEVAKQEDNTNSEKKEETKEPEFAKPVEGEIIKEYAKDNLIYSQTLNEWITHLGIDIKADKTTVVKASADGKVKSIKNDPRYGLTVVIEHTNGFSTVYSNLLTAEFVVAGEDVKQGQTLGTVGNTATFEIADESHLHFEILKDNVQLDPNIYIK